MRDDEDFVGELIGIILAVIVVLILVVVGVTVAAFDRYRPLVTEWSGKVGQEVPVEVEYNDTKYRLEEIK